MFDQILIDKAIKLSELAKKLKLKISIAESCTGGLLSALLTELEGSSLVLDRSFVPYSDEAKIDMLNVDP